MYTFFFSFLVPSLLIPRSNTKYSEFTSDTQNPATNVRPFFVGSNQQYTKSSANQLVIGNTSKAQWWFPFLVVNPCVSAVRIVFTAIYLYQIYPPHTYFVRFMWKSSNFYTPLYFAWPMASDSYHPSRFKRHFNRHVYTIYQEYFLQQLKMHHVFYSSFMLFLTVYFSW